MWVIYGSYSSFFFGFVLSRTRPYINGYAWRGMLQERGFRYVLRPNHPRRARLKWSGRRRDSEQVVCGESMAGEGGKKALNELDFCAGLGERLLPILGVLVQQTLHNYLGETFDQCLRLQCRRTVSVDAQKNGQKVCNAHQRLHVPPSGSCLASSYGSP